MKLIKTIGRTMLYSVESLAFPVIYVALQLIAGMTASRLIAATSTTTEQIYERYYGSLALINLTAALLMLAFAALIWRLIKDTSIGDTEWLTFSLPRSAGLRALGAGASLFLVVMVIMQVIPWPEKIIENYSNHINVITDSPFILQVLFQVAAAPIAEELVYRAGCYSILRRAMPAAPAIILQAAIFGAVHGDPMQFVYAFIMGIILSLVYEWTRSLTTSILLHIAFNASNYLITPFLTDENIVFILVVCVVLSSVFLTGLYRYGRQRPVNR